MARGWIPYHCSVKIFTRGGGSAGSSSVGKAAYRHGVQMVKVASSQSVAAYRHSIELEGKGDTDFTRKTGVVRSDLILPEDAPAWAKDRQELYNEIEKAEDKSTRPKTAQLLREIEVMIPCELWEHSRDKAFETVRAFAERQAKAWGTFADIAIHCPKGRDGDHPHAHILFGLRPLSSEGFGDKAGERERFNKDRGLRSAIARLTKEGKATEADAVATGLTINRIRAAWETTANHALAEMDADGRVDRRSLEAQKEDAQARGLHRFAAWLDRAPQKPIGLVRHLGRAAYARLKDRLENVSLSQHRQQSRMPLLASKASPAGRKRRSLRQAVNELTREMQQSRAFQREGPALER